MVELCLHSQSEHVEQVLRSLRILMEENVLTKC